MILAQLVLVELRQCLLVLNYDILMEIYRPGAVPEGVGKLITPV